MRRLNIPLILGFILILAIAAACFYPEKLTSVDPYSTQGIFVDGNGVMHSAPYPPDLVGPFGSDELGRNVYSQIVYGTVQTMKIVLTAILAILLLAFPLGMLAGFRAKPAEWLLKVANITSSAIPALILCVLVLNLPAFSKLDSSRSVYAFAFVIAAAGFGRMGTQIRQRVEYILSQPFIEGQIVIGKSRRQIAFQNVLPHLLPYLLVYLSLEAGRSLFLVCQLGVLNVFVGNLKYDPDTVAILGRNLSYEPEWGTLLGSTITRYRTSPWMVYPLITVFFLGILGFNLFAEGLKAEFEKSTSHIITWLKKVPYFISPAAFVRDVSRIRKRPLPAMIKLIAVILILSVVFFPKQFAYFPFNSAAAFQEAEELRDHKYEGRRSGTPGREMAAEYIISELKKAGVQPGGTNGYINGFELNDSRMLLNQRLALSIDGGEYAELVPGKDFRVVNFEPVNFKGSLDIISVEGNSIRHSGNTGGQSAAIISQGKMDQQTYNRNMRFAMNGQAAVISVPAAGFTDVAVESDINYFNLKAPIIELNEMWKYRVSSAESIKAEINIDVATAENLTGENIIGIIPGTDSKLDDDFIVIGASYDGATLTGGNVPAALNEASSAAVALETAKTMMKKGQPKRTIVFIFWDYSGRYKSGAFKAGRLESFINTGGNLYIDLKRIVPGKQIKLDTSRVSMEMQEAQRLTLVLTNELKKAGLRVTREGVKSEEAAAMRQRGMAAVVLDCSAPGDTSNKPDNAKKTYTEGIRYIGQGLVNSLIKMAY